MKALLIAALLFKSDPTVFFLDNSCEVVEHRSAPVAKVVPSAGAVILYYGPNSSEIMVADKETQEVHILEKGKYHFFQYRNHILYRVDAPMCEPL